MLKRLWLILGPVFCALLMVTALLFFYPINHKHNYTEEKKAAVSLNAEGFKSRTKKQEALSDPQHRFVPYFGSSEWLRFDVVHPAVLAEKYVVSPQWFTKKGYDSSAFQQFFNSDQLNSFIANHQQDAASQYAAKRLLQQYPNVAFQSVVTNISQGKKISRFDQSLNQFVSHLVQREDALFSNLATRTNGNYDKKVKKRLQDLPDQFSYEKLEEIATAEAKVKTNNNDLGISNHFYNTRLKMKLKKLKGFQKNESYVQSPEYNDLQLVLDQFAKSRTNVIFVIPPVNAKWMKYTGLSQEKYEQAVQKIRYQLESQGFTNIADFSKDGDQPYFMEDTIHMGWNGWLAFDKAVNPFVTKAEKAPTYHLNDRFFSKDWAQYKGTPDEFK